MLEYLRPIWARYKARRKGFIPSRKMVDTEKIKEKLDYSPVSILLLMVLLWVVSSVLLALAQENLRNWESWAEGRPALFTIHAQRAFSAEDYGATAAKRELAKGKVPLHVKIDVQRSNAIRHDLTLFFDAVVRRAEAEMKKTQFSAKDSPIDTMVLSLYRAKEIAAALADPMLRKNADDAVGLLLQHGVCGSGDHLPEFHKGELLVIHSGGKKYTRTPENSEEAARVIADALELDRESRSGFCAVVPHFFESGNLSLDEAATQAEQQRAAAKVEPVMRHYSSGATLISEGDQLTFELRELLKNYHSTHSTKDGFYLFACQLFVSFMVLAAATFFLYTIYPQFFALAEDFALGSLIVILALSVNYAALRLFFYLYAHGILSLKVQLICMIPIALGPALLSVFFGSRVAIFGGALIVGISAQMFPQIDTSRLIFHWLVISTLIALRLRDTNNYRTFFVRLFLGSLALTVIVNADYIIGFVPMAKAAECAISVSCMALACAMTGLLLIFLFELLFNADTRMSLMVLCDFNHPLLERLKREANGTMYHSLNVSVLAEDAANAIRANTLRAKAGALFHDIGKMKMPEYFIENNPASRLEYEKMTPLRSCAIIRNHVREGIILAKEYRLSKFIRKAIITHHGDDLVSFFYRRALEERGNAPEPVLEEQFRYDGPPPHGKEETIISLADACEAACRSIDDPTPKKIEEMVGNIFVGRLRGGQLRMSTLNLHELGIVKECFIKDLCDLSHRRIAYSQEKKDDTAALRVEVPKPSGSAEK